MAVARQDPWPGFNFKVTINRSGGQIRGAFSEISGINSEVTYADYREGTDPQNTQRRIPLMYKNGDVTFKRGLIGSTDIFDWFNAVRKGEADTRADIVIKLMSEDNSQEVSTWTLKGARPMKWTGPTLQAKGASDVAMEEFVVVCDNVLYE